MQNVPKTKSEKLLVDFFKRGHDSESKAIVTFYYDTRLRELYVKYNTAITSFNAVEPALSLARNVLKLKQSGLSDKW